MKQFIIIMCFLIMGKTFAETNIYKFSGAYVTAGNESYSKTLTANEVLNLQDSTQLLFPEFYFSNHGEYGVTNWSAFPTSSHQVGSEFRLEVSRRIDDVLYLSKWDFRYSCFLGWDKKTEELRFAASGGNLTGGEQCLSIGKNKILFTGRDSESTEWIVILIDEIKTPRAPRQPASEEQTKLVSQWLLAIQNGDMNSLKSLYPESDESSENWEMGLKLLKGTLSEHFGKSRFNASDFDLLYAGDNKSGRMIITHKNGKHMSVHIVQSGNEWKIEP